MTTRKMLVPIDLENPEKDFNDFIYPVKQGDEFVLIGIKSGKKWTNGVTTFVGRSLTKNDIFAKIVDSKAKIKNVELMLQRLEEFINQIKMLKLGSVVEVQSVDETFNIEVIGKRPSIKRNSKLP